MSDRKSLLLSILFSDIVGSTEILDAQGQEAMVPVFESHRHLLNSMVVSYGGLTRQWSGDGMMATFDDPGSAVAAAVALQRRLQSAPGEPLKVRMGITTGQVEMDGDGVIYGTPLVVGSRLCDSAGAREIRCTEILRALLPGHPGSSFHPLGGLPMKGLSEPVAAHEIVYDRPATRDVRIGTPLVERQDELARLEDSLLRARSGEPTLVVIEGEAGIGKSRLVEEFLQRASGVRTGYGRCLEGDLGGVHSGLSRCVEQLVAATESEIWERPGLARALTVLDGAVLETGTAPVIAPPQQTTEAVDPAVPVSSAERELQIAEVLISYLGELTLDGPVVLTVDDLHLADRTTIEIIRRLLHRLGDLSVLIIAVIRSGELGPDDHLSVVLGELARRVTPERIAVGSLTREGTEQLASHLSMAQQATSDLTAIWNQTAGNPFYIQELIAERRTGDDDQGAGIESPPRNVRDVVASRVRRMQSDAVALLQRAATVSGPFPLEPIANAAQLDIESALTALDEILDAELIRPVDSWTYEFGHDLTRQSVLAMMNPARVTYTQREVADALSLLPEGRRQAWLAQMARLYHSSRAIGEAAPVWPALAALQKAQDNFSYREQAELARLAIETDDLEDDLAIDLVRHEAMALIASVEPHAIESVLSVADQILDAGDRLEAESLLADGVVRVRKAGYDSVDIKRMIDGASRRLGKERTPPWAVVTYYRLMLEPESSDYPGILTGALVDDLNAILATQSDAEIDRWELGPPPGPRGADAALDPDPEVRLYFGGDFVGTEQMFLDAASKAEFEGRIRYAVAAFAGHTRACTSLGKFAMAEESIARAEGLMKRLPTNSDVALHVGGAREDLRRAHGETLPEEMLDGWISVLESQPETWALAAVRAGLSSALAEVGDHGRSRQMLDQVLRPIELSKGDQVTYIHVAMHAVEAAYLLGAVDLVQFLRENVEAKVLEPDFRAPMSDSRLAMGRLAFTEGDYRQAIHWYELATQVLSSARARPLAAIARLELARSHAALGGTDGARGSEQERRMALEEFTALGMSGWIRRAQPVDS